MRTVVLALLLAGLLAIALDSRSDEPAINSLKDATGWINSPALGPADLRGKVVLVDFWTYTCVNWMRTLPYLREWSQRYGDQGLVVIGVHSPEFSFEGEMENVREAVKALGVNYPVAVDSHHAIWRAYRNQYWPALYVIDREGRVQLRHVGEGDYDRIEATLQSLLGIDATATGLTRVGATGAEVAADWDTLQSGENYLGRARTVNFASPEGRGRESLQTYSMPRRLRLNHWALAGQWTMQSEASVLQQAPGRLAYRFHARDVNLVMGAGTAERPVPFRVLIDGKPPGASHGTDIDAQGNGIAKEPRLYQLIRQSAPIVERSVEIEFLDADVALYSFTFG